MASVPSLFIGDTRPGDHRHFVTIATRDRFEEDRAWLDAAWERCAPFLDPSFARRFRKEFPQRAWELRLAWTMLELGLPLVQREGQDEGPDFQVAAEETHPRTWIEAVTVSHGDGVDRVIEPPTSGGYSPNPRAVMLRYVKAIQGKAGDLRSYRRKGIVSGGDAYVIAINPGEMVRATREFRTESFSETPWIVRVLYGIGESYISIPIGGVPGEHEYEHGVHHQPVITKHSGYSFDSQMFCNPESSAISGVLFGREDVVNRPSEPGRDFIFVHNAEAATRLPSGWLRGGVEYEPCDGVLHYADHRSPTA